ncbi:APC family permease [Actinoplanes regularis]|uniref:Amino acid/polyamine/organocation transporter, APC superfamily n=1 Tax=Actinoplanes regularis TaxID=52697 RepID=A0A239JGV2_9ACTN|nr:APC family permease [Actinoplanes regularis]SNT03964.1 amino acid/polyamine/organocation transporter, APC superfamily [Actinoplanes regularis]
MSHPAREPAQVAEGSRSYLSQPQIVGLAAASMIPAVGIAAVPALLLGSAGTGSWLAALISALVTVAVGFSVIAFARRHVATGALYSYVSTVFGPWARMVTAASLLLGYACMVAGLTMVIGVYVGSFLLSIGVAGGLGVGVQIAVYTAAVLIAVLCARRGIDLSARTAVILMVVSIPVVVVVVVASAVNTGLHLGDQLSFAGGFSAAGIFSGVAAGTTFLVGFESCAALALETRDPRRSVPVAVLGIPIVLGVVYLAATVLQVPGLIAAADDLATGASPAAALARHSGLGQTFATATDLVLAVATFAGLIGFVNFGARFVATIAEEGLLPRWLGRTHPRFNGPSTAVTVLGGVGLVTLVALVTLFPGSLLEIYSAVATLIVYLWVAPYVLICAAHVVLLVRERAARPLPIAAALLGAVAMLWLYVNGLVNRPPAPVDAMSYVSLALVAIVVIGLLLVRRASRSSDPAATPSETTTAEHR